MDDTHLGLWGQREAFGEDDLALIAYSSTAVISFWYTQSNDVCQEQSRFLGSYSRICFWELTECSYRRVWGWVVCIARACLAPPARTTPASACSCREQQGQSENLSCCRTFDAVESQSLFALQTTDELKQVPVLSYSQVRRRMIQHPSSTDNETQATRA